MFLTFQHWRDPGEIAGLCTLCAFGRSEADTEELFAAQRAYLAKTFGADVVTMVLPHVVDVSSTQLRGLLARGAGRTYLDDAVYGYILRQGLYGVGADVKHLPLEDLRAPRSRRSSTAMVSPSSTARSRSAKASFRSGLRSQKSRVGSM